MCRTVLSLSSSCLVAQPLTQSFTPHRTLRPDKVIPNHIGTVLGSLMELAEHVTTEELRYRMSVPAGARDMYRKDLRGMLRQLLEYQRKRNQQGAALKGDPA
jgi:hypothetical protein